MRATIVWFGAAAGLASCLPCAAALAMSRDYMPAYCRGEVSAMYATPEVHIKTDEILTEEDGSLSIGGAVDKGAEGIKKFKCRFDGKGNVIDVMAMTSDGE